MFSPASNGQNNISSGKGETILKNCQNMKWKLFYVSNKFEFVMFDL